MPDCGLEGDRPSVARVYDFLLGGAYNFGADRDWASHAIGVLPGLRRTAEANRAFRDRAVRYCQHAGVRQFLDIGCGLPTAGGLYQTAQRADPSTRVAYVDHDPLVANLLSATLAGNDRACAIEQDLRRPEALLAGVQATQVLDLDQPVTVLLAAVLHYLGAADDPARTVRRLLAPLAAGSHLVISHATNTPTTAWQPVNRLCAQPTATLTPRSRDQVGQLFGGWHLLDPGLVWLPHWHPDPAGDTGQDASWSAALAGVARKP